MSLSVFLFEFNHFIRTKAKLLSVDDKGDGRYLVKNEVIMEIDGQEKPAFIAEALTMYVTA